MSFGFHTLAVDLSRPRYIRLPTTFSIRSILWRTSTFPAAPFPLCCTLLPLPADAVFARSCPLEKRGRRPCRQPEGVAHPASCGTVLGRLCSSRSTHVPVK